jgi:hypothetical protein
MVINKPGAVMIRALADRCRAAAEAAPDQDTFKKFMELAADLDAGAAKSERKARQGNGAA